MGLDEFMSELSLSLLERETQFQLHAFKTGQWAYINNVSYLSTPNLLTSFLPIYPFMFMFMST